MNEDWAAVTGRRDGSTGSASSWALQQILLLIARGALVAGAQLPAERELSLQLGVSRSSIRESLSAMVALGVLDSRHGAGVFVTSLDADHLLAGLRLVLDVVEEERLADLFEVSGALQATTAAMAAARRSDAALPVLARLAAVCREAGSPSTAAVADQAFHDEIGRMSGNPMLRAVADAMVPPEARHTLWRRLWTKEHQALHDEHDRLVEAIGRADPESARAVATAHAFRATLFMSSLSTSSVALDAQPDPQPSITVDRATDRPDQRVIDGPTPRTTPRWYQDAKLGIIVHWGLYSVPGWAPLDESMIELLTDEETVPHSGDEPDPLVTHSFGEWYQNSAMLSGSPTWHYHRATYGRRVYADFRRPFETALRGWDPAEWATLFEQAGARYVVQVAKHHDGFLLWPTDHANPRQPRWSASRDVVGDIGTAVRARGMRFGVYYSSGIDWTFDHLPIRRLVDVPHSMPRERDYAGYVETHWRELIDRYAPSILWNDMGYPATGDAAALFRDYYGRVPDGLVTDRFGTESFDIATPNYARRHVIDPQPWEGVRPLGLSFGWNRQEDDRHILTGTQLIHLLVDVVSKNGNLLLGVSPDDRGHIPELQEQGLRELGRWLSRNGEAVYRSRPWTVSESATQHGTPVRFTTRDGDLFVFLLGRATGDIVVTGLHLDSAATVTTLDGGASIDVQPGRRGSVLRLDGTDDLLARVLRVSPAPTTLVS